KLPPVPPDCRRSPNERCRPSRRRWPYRRCRERIGSRSPREIPTPPAVVLFLLGRGQGRPAARRWKQPLPLEQERTLPPLKLVRLVRANTLLQRKQRSRPRQYLASCDHCVCGLVGRRRKRPRRGPSRVRHASHRGCQVSPKRSLAHHRVPPAGGKHLRPALNVV